MDPTHTAHAPSALPPTSAAADTRIGLPTHLRSRTTCIDAGMYPHIIDEIFNHAGYRGLIALRAACVAWREPPDMFLARHLIFLVDHLPEAVLNGNVVRHPSHRPDILKACQVLDWDAHCEVTPSVASGLKPQVIRMWENHIGGQFKDEDICPCESDTHVVFGWPRRPFKHDLPVDDSPWPPFNPLPFGTRKLVINLSSDSQEIIWQCDSHRPFSVDPINTCSTLKEIVFHVHSPERVANRLHSRLLDLLDCWYFLKVPRAPPFPGIGRTFVNFAAPPAIPDFDCWGDYEFDDWFPVSSTGFYDQPTFEKQVELVVDYLSGTGQWPGGSIEFLSREEYEARVGSETYRIETVEFPWS